MDDLQTYNDNNEELTTSSKDYFRRKAMLLITFPWTTVINMVECNLTDSIGCEKEERFVFVSF